MLILLFRHGIAEDAAPQGDGARRLTKEGIEKTKEAARGLAEIIDKPDAIFASPLVRAVETADILASIIQLKPRTMPSLASGSAEFVLDDVRKLSEDSIVLVGHEPTLSTLASMLCSGNGASFIELKKAGAILLDTGPQTPSPGGANLLWHATPAMLRAIAGR